MNLNKQQFTTEINGKTLTLEVSDLAGQANAAVLGIFGDTSVLVTAVMGKEDRITDYFPLSVDYEERFYAAGKILGSRFVRREGRPSEGAVLSGRMIDRTLRPLFDSRMRRDVQIVITVLSYDEENDPDFISLLSASTALLISDIPWAGPVAGLRLIKTKDGDLLINPTDPELSAPSGGEKQILFEAFVSGTEDKINMIELAGNEAKEDDIIDAFEKAQIEIKKLIGFQKEIKEKIGKPKVKILLKEIDSEIKNKILGFLGDKLEQAIYVGNKKEQSDNLAELKSGLFEYLKSEGVSDFSGVEYLFEEEIDRIVHKNILESEKRPDARKLDEVRSLYAEVGLFKRLHGSALFARGNTQALAVVTLGAPGAEQLMETMESTIKRRFMLHYNFPPFSTGEVKRLGVTNRREIGHGALAGKAVQSLIPSQEEFPYTIRIVSEILSSNGSSSMATVCASSMALMDAGVPIKKAVAGIAMGLMVDQQNYKILTDIQGPEDHYGDMDCKVAGTEDGIAAVQMDVKIEGVTPEILKEVLIQAKKARLEILEAMKKAIDKPKPQVSSFAPIIMTVEINPERIGEVIGPGGKIINKIIADTGVSSIDIEEDGRVFVASTDREKALLAISYIKSLTREFQIGEIIEGEVIKILDFGAIVDLGGGNDGMIHVSELKEGFVEKVEDVVKIGNVVRAKVVKLDNGRIGLSLKAVN
ncbi:MAG: polyribonucleotide nucleotidyltransferase [bacterium]|nr:polyribonucleotide nucleotidyltransferase [bacterium]